MTRHPVSDERSVVGDGGKRPEVERFFCSDLAEHLRVSRVQLLEVARQKRLDRYVQVGCGYYGGKSHMWVTRRGARLLIEHFRAMQGAMWEKGRDWDVEHEKRLEARRKRTAREKAAKAQAKALAELAQLAPAEPCAGVQLAPDEPSR